MGRRTARRGLVRFVTYNVEWFDSLFDDDGNLQFDDRWSRRRDVKRRQQLDAIGLIFQKLDADGVMVIEAPDSGRKRDGIKALETFAAHFKLRARKALIGFENRTQQEITFLFDPDVMQAKHDPKGPQTDAQGSHDAPRFDGIFRRDLDLDAAPELITFSKPPLEIELTLKNGKPLRLLGVHAKSKAPHGARGAAEVIQKSIVNRRKQMAQCIWLRQRVEAHLAAGDDMMVMGDFNDGPGLDEYEKLFGRSSVEIVLGEGRDDRLYDPHAAMILNNKIGARPASSRFYLRKQNRFLSVLLDYIMVSEKLRAKNGEWRIWHPFEDAECYEMPALRAALLAASDHFPVSIDIDL